MQRAPAPQAIYNDAYIQQISNRLTSVITAKASLHTKSQLKADFAPIKYRLSEILALSQEDNTVTHQDLVEVFEKIAGYINPKLKANAITVIGSAEFAGLNDSGEHRLAPAVDELASVDILAPEQKAHLYLELKQRLGSTFIEHKNEATFLVLLSSVARLLQRLTPRCPELKTIISTIDADVKAANEALKTNINEASNVILAGIPTGLLKREDIPKIRQSLASNTYLSVDVSEDMSWLDKFIDYSYKSTTLNPLSHISNISECVSDVDLGISRPFADALIAPYSRTFTIPFTSQQIGRKNQLAYANTKLHEGAFEHTGDEIARDILRYRLPRESTGRTSLSTNFFSTVLTRNACAPVSERETVYLMFCHGNGSTASADICHIDSCVLEYMRRNPSVKKVVATVGDYIGSAATKGKPLTIEESANDTIRLGVKHWIKTKGFVGNDVVIGHSLGGFISAIAMDALHNVDHLPVVYYNVSSLAHPREFANELVRKITGSAVPGFVGSSIVSLCASAYSYNSVYHFERVPVDYRRIVCKFSDHVIPFNASLFAHLTHNKRLFRSNFAINAALNRLNELDLLVENRNSPYHFAYRAERAQLATEVVSLINACSGVEGVLLDESDHNGPQHRTVGIAIDDIVSNFMQRFEASDMALFQHIKAEMNANLSSSLFSVLFTSFEEQRKIDAFRSTFGEFVATLRRTAFNIQTPRANVLLGFLYTAYNNAELSPKLKGYIGSFFDQREERGYACIDIDFAAECANSDFRKYHGNNQRQVAAPRGTRCE